MTWFTLALLLLVALVLVALVAGRRIPREHVAAVSAMYQAPPAEVWAMISQPAQAAAWRTDLKAVDMLPAIDGRFRWKETSRHGVVAYEMVSQQPMVSQVTRITDDTLPYGGQWEYHLAPNGNGTVLSITERGFVNPVIFRLLSRTVFSLTGTMEAYHRSLAAHLGEPAHITSIATDL
jgi:Activator of Hsp90 ATPase homolog 1-like protein